MFSPVNCYQLTSISSEMNAMTTHQAVIKAHRHKKLQSGHYLKFGYRWHFQFFSFFLGGGGGRVSDQPYALFLPKIIDD